MSEIQRCPTCDRTASLRSEPEADYRKCEGGCGFESLVFLREKFCPDPFHRMADRAPDAFDVLREIEWRGPDSEGEARCPSCAAFADTRKHREGCKLAALLSVTPATPPDFAGDLRRIAKGAGAEAERFAEELLRFEPTYEAPATQAEGGSGKTEVYARPECIFHYCPHPDVCKADDRCGSPRAPIETVAHDELLAMTEAELRERLGNEEFEALARRGRAVAERALADAPAASEAIETVLLSCCECGHEERAPRGILSKPCPRVRIRPGQKEQSACGGLLVIREAASEAATPELVCDACEIGGMQGRAAGQRCGRLWTDDEGQPFTCVGVLVSEPPPSARDELGEECAKAIDGLLEVLSLNAVRGVCWACGAEAPTDPNDGSVNGPLMHSDDCEQAVARALLARLREGGKAGT